MSRLADALEIIVPMLRTWTATYDGRWQRAADAQLAPPGPRPNGPPCLIAGKRPRMLDLVARHADAWNAAWYGHPDQADELRARITRLHAAPDAIGRLRGSVELTAGIFVATSPAEDDRPQEAINGNIDEIGEALAGYEPLGLTHLIVHLWPRTVEAVGQLGAAAAVARERTGRTTTA